MSPASRLDGPRLGPPASEPTQRLVVLLHGIGADGNDLIALAPYLRAVMPDALVVAPNAPEPFDMAPFGYQWFSIRDLVDGIRRMEPSVSTLTAGILPFLMDSSV